MYRLPITSLCMILLPTSMFFTSALDIIAFKLLNSDFALERTRRVVEVCRTEGYQITAVVLGNNGGADARCACQPFLYGFVLIGPWELLWLTN